MAQALWWVPVKNEPYRYWHGKRSDLEATLVQVGSQLVAPSTGEVLGTVPPDQPANT